MSSQNMKALDRIHARELDTEAMLARIQAKPAHTLNSIDKLDRMLDASKRTEEEVWSRLEASMVEAAKIHGWLALKKRLSTAEVHENLRSRVAARITAGIEEEMNHVQEQKKYMVFEELIVSELDPSMENKLRVVAREMLDEAKGNMRKPIEESTNPNREGDMRKPIKQPKNPNREVEVCMDGKESAAEDRARQESESEALNATLKAQQEPKTTEATCPEATDRSTLDRLVMHGLEVARARNEANRRLEAEAKAERAAEAKASQDAAAEAKAKRAADTRARQESEARKAAEAKARRVAEALVRQEMEAKVAAELRAARKLQAAAQREVQQALEREARQAAEREAQEASRREAIEAAERRAIEAAELESRREAQLRETETRRAIALAEARSAAEARRAARKAQKRANKANREDERTCTVCCEPFDEKRKMPMFCRCGDSQHECVMCLQCLLGMANGKDARCICGRDKVVFKMWQPK